MNNSVAIAEFDSEEQVLSRVRHPNIIRLLGSGTTPRKFLVLELLSKGSLSQKLGLRSDLSAQAYRPHFTFLEALRIGNVFTNMCTLYV